MAQQQNQTEKEAPSEAGESAATAQRHAEVARQLAASVAVRAQHCSAPLVWFSNASSIASVAVRGRSPVIGRALLSNARWRSSRSQRSRETAGGVVIQGLDMVGLLRFGVGPRLDGLRLGLDVAYAAARRFASFEFASRQQVFQLLPQRVPRLPGGAAGQVTDGRLSAPANGGNLWLAVAVLLYVGDE